MAKKVAVIGAGVGGMATANILAKAGYQVTVYETHNTPGGRAGELHAKGFTFDTGPSWYLMPEVYEHYFNLFDESASDYYTLRKLSPAYKVFFEDKVHITISGNITQDKKVFEAYQKGSGKILESYLDHAQIIYELALKYFLYNPFKSVKQLLHVEIIKNSRFLISGLTTPIHKVVSKKFTSQKLQQILEYPMVFLGASPFSAPSLYQLMSYLDFKQGVYYPKGGMYKIIVALSAQSKKLGVTYHYSSEVSKIIVKDGQAVGVKCKGKEVKYDLVISNSDLYHTEMKLLLQKDRTYTEKYWSKRQAGPSALLMYLGVKGELPQLQHHNLFFVDDWKQNFNAIYDTKEWPEKASIYMSKTSQTDKTAPKDHETLFVLVPLPASFGKVDKNTTKIFTQKYISQIAEMTGIHDLNSRITYTHIIDPNYFGDSFHSWQNTALGMSHTLKQSAVFRPSVKSKKVENLYYVGAGVQPGIGVPMCLISAELVYKSIINDTSAGPLQSIKEVI